MPRVCRPLPVAIVFAALLGTPAAFACGASTDPETAELHVPFTFEDNWVMVDVSLNGEGPFRFMVDTGATGIGRVDTRVREALDLPLAEPGMNSDGVNARPIDRAHVSELRIGNLVLEDVTLPSRDYNHGAGEGDVILDGIVGLNLFDGGLVEINYPARTLTFTRAAHLSENTKGAVALSDRNRVPARVGDQEFLASIDTGSTLSMHLNNNLYGRFDASPLEHFGEGRRANTTFELFRTMVQDPIFISGVTASPVEIIMSNQGHSNNVGGAFLKDYVLQMDLRSSLAALCPADVEE